MWKILVIDDDEIDREAVRLILDASDREISIREVTDGCSGLAALKNDGATCILLDFLLPDMTGLDFLKEIKGDTDNTSYPILMLTGKGSEEVAVDAMKLGACDYIVKDDLGSSPNHLIKTIERAIEYCNTLKDKEHTQRLLNENQKRYKLFSDNVLEAVAISEDGILSDVSNVFCDMFQCEAGDIIGKPILNLISPHMKDLIQYKNKKEDPDHYEAEFLRSDGTIFPAVVREKRLNINERNTRLTTILDITERKKSENQYRRLVENLSKDYFFYSHSIDELFTFVSESLTRMLGYSQKDFMLHWATYLTDNPINKEIKQKADKAVQGFKQPSYIFEILHKSGEQRWLEMSELPVFDYHGNVIAVEGLAKDITESKHSEEKLKYIATHDTLTGLYNRQMLEKQLNDEINRASRYKHDLSVFMLDIDHFKSINDTYGHQTGDITLRNYAKILKSSIRNTDYAARYGGEEFVILLPETGLSKAEELAERIRQKVANFPFPVTDDKIIDVTNSIGIATFPEHAQSSQGILETADLAMYAAKKAGRDQIKISNCKSSLTT